MGLRIEHCVASPHKMCTLQRQSGLFFQLSYRTFLKRLSQLESTSRHRPLAIAQAAFPALPERLGESTLHNCAQLRERRNMA
jgi:hypothetical protein